MFKKKTQALVIILEYSSEVSAKLESW